MFDCAAVPGLLRADFRWHWHRFFVTLFLYSFENQFFVNIFSRSKRISPSPFSDKPATKGIYCRRDEAWIFAQNKGK